MQTRERLPMPRRGFLTGLAALPVAGSGVVLAGTPAAVVASDDDLIGNAWHAQALARGALTIASEEQDAATARLPWWVRSGPIYLDHSGEHVGQAVGWPAIQGAVPPDSPGMRRRIRWSYTDIEEHYRDARGVWGEKAACQFRDKMKTELDARCIAADLEKVRFGLPGFDQRYDAAYVAWSAAERRVEELSQASSGRAATAALLMIELLRESPTAATLAGWEATTAMVLASIALRHLLPDLPEPLAIDVVELLNNPERSIGEMRMSRGIVPLAHGPQP